MLYNRNLLFLCLDKGLQNSKQKGPVQGVQHSIREGHTPRVTTTSLLFIYLFIYLAALGLCCCGQAFPGCGEWGPLCCGAWASHCGGLSRCGARALGMRASVAVARGPSSCGSRAPECRLSSCGARAQLLCGMRDPPRPGLEPVSPALAGRFLTTAPPRKPHYKS